MRSRFRSFADVESFVVKVEDFSYWPCGPMDKASVYGTGDCRFESYQGHSIVLLRGEISTLAVKQNIPLPGLEPGSLG